VPLAWYEITPLQQIITPNKTLELSALGWGSHSLAPLSFRGATYFGVFTLLPMLTGKGMKHHGDILQEAARLAESGQLKPLLDKRTWSLKEVEAAYKAIENGTTTGKLVVNIWENS
jgi:NADPH:quinone reductase-like Zn-dependent oxidoreductase